ncbi:MAG TPA: hypothetical protein VIM13_02290 [Clostridia bacterium]
MKEEQLQELKRDKELQELKRELLKEIDALRREHKSFEKRISFIANLFIPGMGFFIYGESYFRGIISFVLFSAYNLLYFLKILPYYGGFNFLHYMPAVVVWFMSTFMVARMGD